MVGPSAIRSGGVALLVLSMLLAQGWGSALAGETAGHDREFWRGIAKNHFAVPAGQSLVPLLQELSGFLGSVDPEMRDDLAYTIIDQWVRHQDVPATDLNSLADAWRANLRGGIGESGTD